MNLNSFKLVKNKQRPEFCYSYEKQEGDAKYSIFTMNGGKTFLASVQMIRLDGKWYDEVSETRNSLDECLKVFSEFENIAA